MNLVTLGLLLAFFGWAWDARVIRSQILSLARTGVHADGDSLRDEARCVWC